MRPTRVRSIPRLARSGSGDNRSGADQPRMKRRKGTSSVKSHNTKDSKSAASDRRTPAYGIVSDDFTGGLLVASYFEEAGIVCPVYFDPLVAKKDRPSDGIVIIVTRSRLEPVPEARRQIAVALDALDAIGCESIGYKVCGTFDSTEQGNIGPAADLIAERYDQTPLFISGGFVEYGITVYNGHMFIRNDLISESLKRLDPVTPMPDPNLVRFLSLQTRTPVGLIAHAELSKSNNAASDAVSRLVKAGYRHIMLDATGEDDLRASIFLAKKAKAIVGSDSFIIYFGMDRAKERRGDPSTPRHADGPAALFVGSVGPVAGEQLAVFRKRYPVLDLNIAEDVSEEAIIERSLQWALPKIGDAPFGVTTWMDDAGVRETQAKLGRLGAARKAERLLSGIAAGVHEMGVRRIMVGGGETSGAIGAALNLSHVRSLPRGWIGGGVCIAEGPDPVSLFLKSGKLGTPDVFMRALEIMRP
jgi:3-dehydrotetronate 4-kinase